MKDIIEQVLSQQIDFSIYPPGGPTANIVAQKIVDALGPYARIDDIGSRTEYEKSAS